MLIAKVSGSSCGHCGKREPTYDMCHAQLTRYKEQQYSPSGTVGDTYAVGVCRGCDNFSLLVFPYKHSDSTVETIIRKIKDTQKYFESIYSSKCRIYPEPTSLIDFQQEYPEEVVDHLLAAEELKTKNNPQYASSILSSCRTALEIAIKNIKDEEGKPIDFGKHPNLSMKIMHLRERNLITREIADWSSHVRVEGNKAVHEGKASIEEATECFEFVKLFCHIIFTLPALITQKRLTNSVD